jgi:flagellar motility protein MotE (MotC chaperone)
MKTRVLSGTVYITRGCNINNDFARKIFKTMKHTKKFMVVPYREDDLNTTKKITNSEFNKNIIDQDTKSDYLNRHDTNTNTNDLKNVQNTLQIILSKLKKEEHRKALEKRTNKQERYSVKQISEKKK